MPLVLLTYVIEELVGMFDEKELRNTNQSKFRIKTLIKRKGDKIYAKLKGYDNSFNIGLKG